VLEVRIHTEQGFQNPVGASVTKAARTFGADDKPGCPKCGMTMTLIRRTPHSEHGDAYERQTFTCRECGHEIERSADTQGKPPR
jgi:transposase-like protein